jgi:hypothetical protein
MISMISAGIAQLGNRWISGMKVMGSNGERHTLSFGNFEFIKVGDGKGIGNRIARITLRYDPNPNVRRTYGAK